MSAVETKDGEYSYIGREPCGCISCAIVISENTKKKDIPRELVQWARWGLTIDRVLTEGLRTDPAFLRKCEKCLPSGKAQKSQLPLITSEGE